MLYYDRIEVSEWIDVKKCIKNPKKQAHQKNVMFVTIGIS